MKKNQIHIIHILFFTSISFNSYCQNWEKILPEGGNCTILMPAKPEQTKREINHPTYGKLTMNMSILKPKDSTDLNLLYALSYSDYPVGTIHSDSTNILENFFNASRDGAIANVQGKFLSETILNLSKYPGRELRIDFKNGLALIRSRNYLVKNRLYTIQIITLTKDNFNISINKFLDSFSLTF
jgi:hypothetical protein